MSNTSDKLTNLFIYESQMRSLYEIFAKKAQKEGFLLISNLFNNISILKKQYIKWIFHLLHNTKEDVQIDTNNSVDFKVIIDFGTTLENLATVVKQQDYECRELYPEVINTIKEDGITKILSKLKTIVEIKKKKYHRLASIQNIFELNILMKGNDLIIWICQGCGFEIAEDNLPDDFICPLCGHLKSYFEKQNLNIFNNHDNIWKCMECGEELMIDQIPDSWICDKCGSSKDYFKKKPAKEILSSFISDKKENIIWQCMECGEEVLMDNIPDSWNCIKCGRSKVYFKRKGVSYNKIGLELKNQEKAVWICKNCGHTVEFNLHNNWKCPLCDN